MPYKDAAILEAAVVLAEYIEKLCSEKRWKKNTVKNIVLVKDKYENQTTANCLLNETFNWNAINEMETWMNVLFKKMFPFCFSMNVISR